MPEERRRESRELAEALAAQEKAARASEQLLHHEREHDLMVNLLQAEASELQRHQDEIEALKGREWARDGPETTALIGAKVALAEANGGLMQHRQTVRRDLEEATALAAAAAVAVTLIVAAVV